MSRPTAGNEFKLLLRAFEKADAASARQPGQRGEKKPKGRPERGAKRRPKPGN